MAKEPCSPVNKPGGPQGKTKQMPKQPLPKSPGAKSNPSNGAKR
jgi:hypothetical protein